MKKRLSDSVILLNLSILISVTEEVLLKGRIVLICEGLDTVANLYVNDAPIGSSDNMFVRHVFDIKSALKVKLYSFGHFPISFYIFFPLIDWS